MEKCKETDIEKLTALFNTKDVLFVSPFIGHIFHLNVSLSLRMFPCSHSKYASKFARKIPPKT